MVIGILTTIVTGIFIVFTSWLLCLWRRQWQPTPVLLPGKSHGWRSLVGCSPWGLEDSDTTEQLHFYSAWVYFVCWAKWCKTVLVIQSCPTLCDPMDYSLPGSSVHGIFQAVDNHSLLQGIFPTQGSNLSLLHCRQIFQGSHSPCSKDFQGRWSMYKKRWMRTQNKRAASTNGQRS